MKVKLISDGTPPGTIITNAETGEEIGKVRSFAERPRKNPGSHRG